MIVTRTKLRDLINKRAYVAAGVFLTILLLGLLSKVPFISTIFHGVQSSFVSVGTSLNNALGRVTRNENEFIEQRDYYQALASDLAIDQSRLNQLERDVEEMEALLSYTETVPYKSIAARVIARSPQGIHTMTVDKGIVDGVKENLAVVIENGHMIGYISKVKQHSSVIKLLQHPDSKSPAMLIGTQETSGLVEGQGGFLLHMDFIPQRIELRPNDVVVTSGLDGVYPQGLVIGAIDSIIKNETAAFQESFIQPFYDANTYTNVLILDPFENEL